MKQIALIFIGGGFGSVLRFLISKTFNNTISNFYLGTFFVNSIGCLLIGFLLGLSLKNNFLNQNQTLLLVTGFCGGFTTFSTFAFENYSFLKTEDIFYFSIYTISSIVIGIAAVSFGVWITKFI
ncbi:fluoride efflux transporter CrcB [Cellulophaga sp. HaHaR_3_176]|uniref:fluoride efflux transporter CrcB n=1 Tax=Cellulophaga sp. HaHaR_3_176 TaxID=1942464 RepID=UPI001C1FFE5D|nr:fluoride efflux transporter CrcB [Cellulophaga sp. HaHaR_3_176]QWX82768.1 fluoride efflux transporter CrcB [Cellulophaga sp. HaHaR_3_176]